MLFSAKILPNKIRKECISSSMRTVRCSGRLGCICLGVSAHGGVCPGGGGGVRVPGGCTPSPSVDRILDTRLWKHYLYATTVAGGNNKFLAQAHGLAPPEKSCVRRFTLCALKILTTDVACSNHEVRLIRDFVHVCMLNSPLHPSPLPKLRATSEILAWEWFTLWIILTTDVASGNHEVRLITDFVCFLRQWKHQIPSNE